jgi:glycine betaine catabolism A
MSTFQRASIATAAYTLPRRYYADAEYFAHEQRRIFADQWFFAARSEEIAEPGQYALVEIGEESLILVRDRQGVAHAHYNVCRHRGTRMCEEQRGRFSETIMCPYHAWTYSLDGRLVGARHMQDAPGFDKADWPLLSAHVAEWEGFIFLNLAEQPEPFEAAFASLLNRFPQWGMADLKRGGQVIYEVKANWKLLIQNYSECYHCPLIHPALVELSPWQSGRNDLSEGPFLGGYMDLDHDSQSMTTGGGATARPYLPGLDSDDQRRVYYYSIFPNMLLSLHPDYVMAHRLIPRSVGHTTVVCEWYFHPEAMAMDSFDPSDAVGFWNMTNEQDWHVCELSQLGIASKAYAPGPYAQAEGLLAAFDRFYIDFMGEE